MNQYYTVRKVEDFPLFLVLRKSGSIVFQSEIKEEAEKFAKYLNQK